MDERIAWRKSSYSGNLNECVEVAFLSAATAVRDSKLGEDGAVLTFGSSGFGDFLRKIKAGGLDC